MASAVMFTRLVRHVDPDVNSLGYRTMGYGPGQNGVEAKVLDGDENAILDYRFSPSDKLTWYFDHHVSAFPKDADRAAFDAQRAAHPDRFFHDGTYGSCTKLIADLGKEKFGFEAPELRSLIEWADLIDRAAFSERVHARGARASGAQADDGGRARGATTASSARWCHAS